MTMNTTKTLRPAVIGGARQYFDHPRHHRTAGVASRDAAFAACADATNRCNDVYLVIQMGGPLDACDVMPAGSCNSDLWADWKARPLVTVSHVDR
jgi:hypothetical protein